MSKDGHQPMCKICQRKIQKSYREKRTLKYMRLHPLEDQNVKIIPHRIIKKEKKIIDEKSYCEFINNTKIKSKTSKSKTIPKWMCPVCQKNKVQSKHHIIPRKYNGNNDKTNLIWLCNTCHDIIELKTEDWIESGKGYDINFLRHMILNDGL